MPKIRWIREGRIYENTANPMKEAKMRREKKQKGE